MHCFPLFLVASNFNYVSVLHFDINEFLLSLLIAEALTASLVSCNERRSRAIKVDWIKSNLEFLMFRTCAITSQKATVGAGMEVFSRLELTES